MDIGQNMLLDRIHQLLGKQTIKFKRMLAASHNFNKHNECILKLLPFRIILFV